MVMCFTVTPERRPWIILDFILVEICYSSSIISIFPLTHRLISPPCIILEVRLVHSLDNLGSKFLHPTRYSRQQLHMRVREESGEGVSNIQSEISNVHGSETNENDDDIAKTIRNRIRIKYVVSPKAASRFSVTPRRQFLTQGEPEI